MDRIVHHYPQGYSFQMEGEKGEAVGYLCFPSHPGVTVSAVVSRSLRLSELIGVYSGPDVMIDFDSNNRIIGLEIVE